MKPMTWTEPEQSGASKCTLVVSRVPEDEERIEFKPATPSDVAAALNAAGVEVVREIWCAINVNSSAPLRRCAEELSAAIDRAKYLERERDTLRAELDSLRNGERVIAALKDREASLLRSIADDRAYIARLEAARDEAGAKLDAVQLERDAIRYLSRDHKEVIARVVAERDQETMLRKVADAALANLAIVHESSASERDALRAKLAALRDAQRLRFVERAFAARCGENDPETVAKWAIQDADAMLAALTTPVQPATPAPTNASPAVGTDAHRQIFTDPENQPAQWPTPALAPDDAAELEAYRALFRWTEERAARSLRQDSCSFWANNGGIGTCAPTPQALAAKLGAK